MGSKPNKRIQSAEGIGNWLHKATDIFLFDMRVKLNHWLKNE